MKTSWSLTDVSACHQPCPAHSLIGGLTDLDRRLAIAELLQLDLRRVLAKAIANVLDEARMRTAGEDTAASHVGGIAVW